MMTKHIRLDFQSVFHFKLSASCLQQSLVAHLAARLCIKRCGVQHHHAVLTGLEFCGWRAIYIQRQHFGSGLQLVVTHKGVACAGVLQRAVHFEFTSRTGLGFLTFHGSSKASLVHAQIALTADVGRQVQGEAVGVVQFESHVTRQYFDATFKRRIQNLHTHFKGFEEALFFSLQDVGDAFFLRRQAGVSSAHQLHKVGHQLVEERCFLTQLVTVSDGAANDAALHIATTFVARHHTIADQECSGTNVIGNDAQ